MSDTRSHEPILATGRFFHQTLGSRLGATATKPKKAVFLDRDGVLIADEGHLTNSANLKVLPGVTDALLRLRDDFYLIVITNQSCVSRGLLTEDGLREVHVELYNRLAADGATLDGIYYCPHHPIEGQPPFRTQCQCRKPQPGMLFQASKDWNIDLKRSFMVGDKPTDAGAAQAAGVEPIVLGVAVPDLLAAAEHIVPHSKPARAAVPGGSE